MQKLLILTLCLLQSLSVLRAETTVFTLQITDNLEPYLGIWLQKSEGAEMTYSRIPLNTPESLSFELDIPFKQSMIMEYGKLRFPVIATAGKGAVISFDGTNVFNSLSFEGAFATENNFTAEFKRKYGVKSPVKYELAYLSFSVSGVTSRRATAQTPEVYFSKLQEKKKNALSYLTDKRGTVDPELIESYEKSVHYRDLTERMAYCVINREKLGLIGILKTKDKYSVSGHVAASVKHKDLPAYQNYLKARLQYDYLPGSYGNARQVAPIIYDLANSNFKDADKWYLKSEILCKYLNYTGDPALGQEQYPAFYKECPYPEYIAEVEKCYGSDLNAMTSTPAPLLETVTDKGVRVALQDYQGKVVYVSFWASWCKPCLRNFTKYEDTRRQLQEMGVVLFNVSIDETREAFIKSLDRQPVLGVNALAADLDKTKIEYNLATIPAYYIIDKNGKFAFLSEGTDRDIVEEFRALVNK